MFQKILLIGGLAIVLLANYSSGVMAAPLVSSGESVIQDIVVGDDAYLFGEIVTISKDVRGDLQIAGGDVTIHANVSGDILVMGGTVIINGNVSDDLRVAGGTVTVAGNIGDDLIVAGGNVTIADTGMVRGDLMGAAGTLNLYGRIYGSAKLAFGTGRINGKIDGDANIRYSEELTFGKDARIGGQFNYWAESEDESFESVASKVTFNQSTGKLGDDGIKELLSKAGLMALIWKWLSVLFVGSILIWVLPKFFPRVVDGIKTKSSTGQFILSGFVFLVLVPILASVFAVTIVGLPIAAILFLGFFLFAILAAIVGAYGLGSYIRHHRHTTQWDQFANLALGIFIALLMAHIPFVGGLLQALLVMYGLGVVWMELIKASGVYRKTTD